MGYSNYIIEGCLLYIDVEKTKVFYESLPHIKDNCQCEDCAYYEDVIINTDIKLFKILESIGVNLRRQPNINPDGICSMSSTGEYNRSYMGYYLVFGKIPESENSLVIKNENKKSLSFAFLQKDSRTGFEIKMVNDSQIVFEFFLEIEKNR